MRILHLCYLPRYFSSIFLTFALVFSSLLFWYFCFVVFTLLISSKKKTKKKTLLIDVFSIFLVFLNTYNQIDANIASKLPR